ncbi:MAG: hypothetical protein DSZ00_02355 [Gammaproteobacteria bacterium]|nr:MAG: hypothetical protein DSZ02_04935 [Gammaproteobacteria bacterium]RTZ75271.1 MAG: hypothetical protein DSZ00_02355 [Gammaproteobacteria bacterium]RTZ78174.1 MAG: hypothetical protein DSZ01_05680 [Gammaproteobacteria bacterium]
MAKVRNRKKQAQAVAEAASAPTITIGERLRHARESRGLDVPTVAEQLHLKQSMVLALEGEDFSRLPARVFVRGYYRNYARLMELPEEQLLREFDARCPEGEECAGAPPVVAQSVKKEIRSSHGLVKLMTWLVVISVLAAFGLWWKDYSEKQAAPVSNELEPTKATEGAAGNGAQVAPAVAALPAEGAPVPPPTRTGTEKSEAQQPAKEVSKAAAAPGESAVQPAAPAAETESPAPVAAPKQVQLQFNEDSWVDIRGANRSFKLVGTRKAGERVELDGEPPYNIILGNARGVTILVDGKPYDFSSRTRRNVARLTLDP